MFKGIRTLLIAAAILWASAAGAAPINVRVTLAANPDGVYSTAFPCTASDRSNCAPPSTGTLQCIDTGAPSLSGLIAGTSYSENARAYFTGSLSGGALLGVSTVSGSDATTSGWAISGGDNLTISSATVAAGALMITGTASGVTANCSARTWSRVNAGADTTPPTPPTGLSVTLNASNKPVLTFDAPCDPNVSGSASGLATYTVTRNGTPLTPVAITGGGTNFTSGDVGAVSPAGTTVNTNGADFLETSEGGVGSTADRFHFSSTSITGDFVATAEIESFASVTVNYAKTGIMARDTSSTTARNVLVQMRPGTFTGMQFRPTDGVATSQSSSSNTQPVTGYIQLIRSGDTWTMNQSANGAGWINTVPATTVLLPPTVLVGLATSSESAGNPIQVQYRHLCIRSAAPITYTDTTALAGTLYSYTVHATDVATNSSAESAAVSVTTNGGAPDFTVRASGGSFVNTTAGIASAIAAAAGADKVIEFQTVTPGGSETWNATITCASQDHWRIRVRDGDTIRLSGQTSGGIQFTAGGCDYAIIQGHSTYDYSGLEFGNTAQWIETTPSGSGYTAGRQIYITGTNSHIILRNLTTHGGNSFVANLIDGTNTQMLVDHISASLHGTNCPPVGAGVCTSDAAGELFELDADHSIIQNSSFSLGGHDDLNLYCFFCIARNNDFNGDWTSKNTGAPGYRVVDIGNQDVSNWHPAPPAHPLVFGPVLFEKNFVHDVNTSSTTRAHDHSMKAHGFAIIHRGNYIYNDATGQAVNVIAYLSADAGENESRLHMYNDTLYNTQGLIYSDDSGFSAQGTHNCRYYKIKNNIAALTGSNGQGSASAIWTTSKCAAGANADGFPNGLKGSEFDSNLISGTSTNKRWQLVMPSGSGTIAWGDSTTWPDSAIGYIARNLDTVVAFTNAAAHTADGFSLAVGSAGIDTARYVTTTTNAGTNTTPTLADPYYFSDGWGINNTALGEPAEVGDWIAVTPTSGGTVDDVVCTRISSINYSTGALVVSPSITYAVGSKVWPAGNGTTCQPWRNQGATQ